MESSTAHFSEFLALLPDFHFWKKNLTIQSFLKDKYDIL